VVLVLGGLIRAYSIRNVARAGLLGASLGAVALAVLVAMAVEWVAAGLAGFDVGSRPEHYVWALRYALAAGVAVLLSGIAGYGIFTVWHRDAPLAVLGVIVLPIALLAWNTAALALVGDVDDRIATLDARASNAALEERSSVVTPMISVVSVDYGEGPGTSGASRVERLTIELVLEASAEVRLVAGGFVTANQDPYQFVTPDLFRELSPAGPIVLAPGKPAMYTMLLEANPAEHLELPESGPWAAKVWLNREDGEVLICDAQFVVPDRDR
jgi:hypothetical protein